MSKSTSNSGKAWTKSEVAAVKEMAKGNTPTRVIALKVKRTPEAIYTKASQEGISLKPNNQAPYGTKKK